MANPSKRIPLFYNSKKEKFIGLWESEDSYSLDIVKESETQQ